MRIACVGKGGSGKTTLAALLARVAASRGMRVLAIDADINQHLAGAIGTEAPPPLGARMQRIAAYVRGTNPRIASDAVVTKTTPPGTGSRFIDPDAADPLLAQFVCTSVEGIALMATGALTEDDFGLRCFHSKVMPVELLLNHLRDTQEDLVIVDMTAGADAFASGLFTRFDLLLIVCEPTLRSVAVLEQFLPPCTEYNVPVRVVANKVESPDDAAFLSERVGDRGLATLPRSLFIRALDRGEHPALAAMDPALAEGIDTILAAVAAVPRDWERLQRQGEAFHYRNAVEWMNTRYSTDLTTQIDPTFTLATAMRTQA